MSIGVSGEPMGSEERAIQQNKDALLRAFAEIFDQRNVAAVDELFTPDVVFHSTARQEGPTRGREEYKEFVRGFLGAFTDIRFEVHDIIGEGDRVVARATGHARQVGEYQGIPATGRTIAVPEMIMVRAVDGRCAEAWSMFDAMAMLQQLGVMPRGKPPRPVIKLILGLQRLAAGLRGNRSQ
jgi:steroid delta-isomerase-like uncharacterized protein